MKNILIFVGVGILVLIGCLKVNANIKAPPADYGTDYTCMSECLSAGYLYGLCKKMCSY